MRMVCVAAGARLDHIRISTSQLEPLKDWRYRFNSLSELLSFFVDEDAKSRLDNIREDGDDRNEFDTSAGAGHQYKDSNQCHNEEGNIETSHPAE